MNNLIPFVSPTFYTPKNLSGKNSLNNLTPPVQPAQKYSNALANNYGPNNLNSDNSTNGDQHGTPMSDLSFSEAAQSMAGMQSNAVQGFANYALPPGVTDLANMAAESDMNAQVANAMNMSPAAFSGQIGQMSPAGLSAVGNSIGGSTGMSAGQVSAAGENAAMGMPPGMASAAALGFGVGTGDISAPSQDIGINGDVGIGGGIGVAGAAGSANNPATQSSTDSQPAATGNVADGQGSISGHDTGGPGGGGPTVICTELHRQGLMSDLIYEADKACGQTVPYDVRCGYLMWGIPTVKIMRKSKAFTRLVNILAKPWSRHMAYKMGATDRDSLTGRALMAVGVPLCRWLARSQCRSQRQSAS